MSDFYKPLRTKNLFDPGSQKPFRVSRSKIEDFLRCRRCFYIDRRLGINPPPGFPFTLNTAVDELLKREFDECRSRGHQHPLMKKHKIAAIPYAHENLDIWRDSLRGGLRHLHAGTSLLVTGGIDDVWVDKNGWLNVVDYKATSKKGPVGINAEWQRGYKRQIEIYQWIFRRMGFKVSDTAYFVYCNGDSEADRFDLRLNFNVEIIPYSGNDFWVEDVIYEMKDVLMGPVPPAHDSCDNCLYQSVLRQAAVN